MRNNMEVKFLLEDILVPSSTETIISLLLLFGFVAVTVKLFVGLLSNSKEADKSSLQGWIWLISFFLNYTLVAIPGRFDDLAAGPSQSEYMRQQSARQFFRLISHREVHWDAIFKPASYVFIIWALIYVGELAYTILTALISFGFISLSPMAFPHKMSISCVVSWAVGHLLQALWCCLFRPYFKRYLWLTNIILVISLVAFCTVHVQLSETLKDTKTAFFKGAVTCIRFVVALHAGWLSVGCLLGINAWFAVIKLPYYLQYAAAMASPYVGAIIAVLLSHILHDVTLSAPIAWGLIGVAYERQLNPHAQIDIISSQAFCLTCSTIGYSIFAGAVASVICRRLVIFLRWLLSF